MKLVLKILENTDSPQNIRLPNRKAWFILFTNDCKCRLLDFIHIWQCGSDWNTWIQ